MALHGQVQVNFQTIATWEAVNTGEKLEDATVYRCKVKGRDMKGYPYEHKFIVLHNYGDGPLVLTGIVMKKAATFTRG